MPKFEIIVRETRVLKYKIEAPTQQIGIDRIITDSYINPMPYQTQRLSREIYAVDLPEVASNPPPVAESRDDGLTTHPTEPKTPTPAKKKRGRKR